jgi:hypothetical protein
MPSADSLALALGTSERAVAHRKYDVGKYEFESVAPQETRK